ncbi:hypothetical protein [Brevibacillus sp. DP1.3A]|uniref:hypothetical protein n=1 Tax=Brevibacillus sp. DP1.3A TaxID=2738867 RepID=UPI00156AB1FA|nr:hypothetical protein [Brevibacillus sp. DP1.3A]UED78084.1 hypothetical protein HP399_030635 [Brevibacillus sp. DP1.3A]
MLSLNVSAEKTILGLLAFIDKIATENHPTEASNLLPELVNATAELIKSVNC